MEQCVKEDPDNQTYKWFLAIAYIDRAYELWTFVPEDIVAGDIAYRVGHYATTKEQVLAAQALVAKAEALNVDDEDLKERILHSRRDIDAQLEREFYGSIWPPILGGIVWLFIIDAYIPGGWWLGLVLAAAYFAASRPPKYAINKMQLAFDLPRGASIVFFLPIILVANGVKYYTGQNKI